MTIPPVHKFTTILRLGILAAFTSLAIPADGYASDFTGLALMLLGAVVGTAIVVFGVTWFVTRWIPNRSLQQLIRSAAVCLFLTPVYVDEFAGWWPSFFFIGDPEKALWAWGSIAVATVILWRLALVFFEPQPKAAETNSSPPNT